MPGLQDARRGILKTQINRCTSNVTPSPIGIGHNNPPADIEGPDLPEIQKSVAELKLEFQQPKPVVAKIKQWAKPLRDALVAAGRWAAQKADKAVDAAMKPIGTGLGAYVLDQYVPPIHHAFQAIIDWLEIAAKTLFYPGGADARRGKNQLSTARARPSADIAKQVCCQVGFWHET